MEKEVSFMNRFLIPALALIALSELLLLAARPDIQILIRKRSQGKCEKCKLFVGVDNIIVAHLDHRRKSGRYNSPNNLLGLCLCCEARHHLAHVFNPKKIGMTAKKNDPAAWGRFLQLPILEQNLLRDVFSEEITYLEKKYTSGQN